MKGSAIGLASLSIFQDINHKISHFIGLAPALVPNRWNESITGAIDKMGPHNLTYLFGNKSFMSIGTVMQEIMPAKVVKVAVKGFIGAVLGWKCEFGNEVDRELFLYQNIVSHFIAF